MSNLKWLDRKGLEQEILNITSKINSYQNKINGALERKKWAIKYLKEYTEELTQEEIERRLGYKVKIVTEDK